VYALYKVSREEAYVKRKMGRKSRKEVINVVLLFVTKRKRTGIGESFAASRKILTVQNR